MLLVIDANIALSALTAGNITDLVLSDKLDLISPERFFIEIGRHRAEILAKSRLSESEFELLSLLLEKKIRIVPMDEFISFLPKAEELLGEHKKDAPYIALALMSNCPFWSYEKRFLKIDNVEVLTTKEVRDKVAKLL